MALSALVTLNTLVTTEPFAFTPEKVSTELSLGTVSGKTKERVYLPEEKGCKASWTGNTVMRQLSRGHLTGICYQEYLSVPLGGQH